jgi:2-polyprenyl-6-methoxyphenol hydroxylase-like FAD-dependent oxidoreductase
MARVAVLGGAVTGLATALFLARRGHEATVIERDADLPTGDHQHDFDAWRRPGVPQVRQPHVFHALGARVLREELPDVAAVALDEPGLPIHVASLLLADPQPGDEELVTMGLRRISFESALRRAVQQQTGITVLEGVAVEGLIANGERVAGAPHIVGVRTDREPIDADVVVDATGRRSQIGAWLAELDARAPVDDAQDLRFAYHTRWYRVPDGGPPPLWPPFRDLGFGTALAFPADDGYVGCVYALAIGDPKRGRLRDPEVFDRLASEIDVHRRYLEAGATPVTDVLLMARLENRSRRLVDDRGPIVTGAVALGDAAVYTNPTLGRGVSLALAHAQRFAHTVEQAVDDPASFAVDFDAWTQAQIFPWFATQVAADGVRLARVEAALNGTQVSTDARQQFSDAMFACAATDPYVARVLARVFVLLAPPETVVTDTVLQQRVGAFLETTRELPAPTPAITRERFEQLVS